MTKDTARAGTYERCEWRLRGICRKLAIGDACKNGMGIGLLSKVVGVDMKWGEVK